MAHAQDISGFDPTAPSSQSGRRIAETRPLSARLLPTYDAAETLWREMERADHVGIHQSHDWCTAWANLPGAETRIVAVEMDGEPAALIPLEIVRRGGIAIARLIGTRHSNANSPLFSEAFLKAVGPALAAALIDSIRALDLGADMLVLDKLRPLCGVYPQPLLALPTVTNQNPSFQLPLLADFEATLRQVNAKRRRKKFRVSQRRLAALGGYRHEIARDEETAQAWLAAFFVQKAARLKAQGLPDVFADPGTRAALARLVSFEQNGGTPPLVLHAIVLTGQNGETPVALAGLTEKDGHVTCQFGSIDDRVAADASVGELLFHHMIEQACATSCHVFDFGVGDQPYKRSWCPVMTEHADLIVPLTMKGRPAALAFSMLVRAKRLVKTSPRLHRAAARLRALVAGGREPAEDAG